MHTRMLFDKKHWKDGPWSTEPDYTWWVDADTLYRCVARRSPVGAWGGFVGVGADHPLFMAKRYDAAFAFIDVHGSVSSAEFFAEPEVFFSPPQRMWWIGFDCMHDCDLLPECINPEDTPKFFPRQEEEDTSDRLPAVYRDLEYVINEVGFLAMQLAFFEDRDHWT